MAMVQEQLTQTTNKSSRKAREVTRRLSKLTEAQAVGGWAMIILLVAVLGVIYLTQSSQMAIIGRHVQELQYEVGVIQRENAEIEREIANFQSLSRLQKEAEKMGFVAGTGYDVDYIAIENYPALIADDIPDENPQYVPPVPVETAREALWVAFSKKINNLMLGESRE